MNACEKFELQLPSYVAGELSETDAAQLRAHLDGCPACREQAESLRLLHGAMAMSPLPEKLDAHRVAAIVDRFRLATSPRRTAASGTVPFRAAAARIGRWLQQVGTPRPSRKQAGLSWMAPAARFAVFVAVPLILVVILAEPSTRRSMSRLSLGSTADEFDFVMNAPQAAAGPEGKVRALSESGATPASGKDWEETGRGKANRAAGSEAEVQRLYARVGNEAAPSADQPISEFTHGGASAAAGRGVRHTAEPGAVPPAQPTGPASAAGRYNLQLGRSKDPGRPEAARPAPTRPALPPAVVAATPAPAPAAPAAAPTAGGVVPDAQGAAPGAGPGASANYFAHLPEGRTAQTWGLQTDGSVPAPAEAGYLVADGGAPANRNFSDYALDARNGRAGVQRGTLAQTGAEQLPPPAKAANGAAASASSDRSLLAYDAASRGDQTQHALGLTGGGTLDALRKSGAGTLSLEGGSSYSGGSVVNGGMLAVHGPAEQPDVGVRFETTAGIVASDKSGKPETREEEARLGAVTDASAPLDVKGFLQGRTGGGRARPGREGTELASAAKRVDESRGRDAAGVDLHFDQSESKKEAGKSMAGEELPQQTHWFGSMVAGAGSGQGPASGGGAGAGGIAGAGQREEMVTGEKLARLTDGKPLGEGITAGRQLALGDRDGDEKKADVAKYLKDVERLADNRPEPKDDKLAVAGDRLMAVEDRQAASPVVVGQAYAERRRQKELESAEPLSKLKGETVALQTEYPKPMFVGTPAPMKLPNLEQSNAGGHSTRAYSVPKSTMDKYKEADGYDGLARHLEAEGLKTPAGSKATYDAETEQLVVTSTPQGLTKFDDFVAKLEEPAATPADPASAATAGKVLSRNAVGYAKTDLPRPAPPRAPAGFNPYVDAAADAFSTFSIDVDTASFTLTRRAIEEGRLPDPEQVRTEEIVNAFDYDYAPPANGAFAMHAELVPSPFRAPLELLKVGIQGRVPGRDAKKAAVLTLVIDTSGSMDTADRLGRIRTSLKMLAGKLQPQDSIAIVAFNTEARLLLDRTAGSDQAAILAAVDSLTASGSTQLEGGMRLGYEVAARGFLSGAANRVILMSDGVANLGAATAQEILASVAQFRAQGIYLTVLGFGSGNYDDAMLLQLADKGDGMYAFVDSDEEASRLLVDQWEQTLHVIAKDVKIQIEFNPERVVRWRQIGYEKRQLTQQDFRNDAVDAGEVGSGQAVTALYDVELRNAGTLAREAAHSDLRAMPIATMRVRYKDPDTGAVTELEQRIADANRSERFASAPARARVAACAAEFAELLRVSPYTAGGDFAAVIEQLRPAAAELSLDQRVQELLRMAERASGLAK